MALNVKNFRVDPNTIPPAGDDVKFFFTAQGSGAIKTIRARIHIPESEPFVFEPAESGNPKEVFFPAINQTLPAPPNFKVLGPKPTRIAAVGSPDPTQVELPITVTLLGFDAGGQEVADESESLFITFDKLSMAMKSLQEVLGLTQAELAERLGVSASTLRRVQAGESSDKVRQGLEKLMRVS